MTPSARLKTLLWFLVVVAANLSADAAEIRLKSDCVVGGPLVRLGDVADLLNCDDDQANELARIELFPAPALVRYVRAGEVRELLALTGIDDARFQFTGAAVVAVYPSVRRVGAVEDRDDDDAQTRNGVDAATARRARQRVEQAITQYLRDSVDAQAAWNVEADPADVSASAVALAGGALRVEGGADPWTGRQAFAVTVHSLQGDRRLQVRADVSLPEMVVVAARSLRRGEIVGEGDVALAHASGSNSALTRIEDATGRELTRSVSIGQPIDEKSVRSPVLVRRGEVVTVMAYAAGVRVRTTAVARDEGSLGDLVAVQTLDRKQQYMARVAAFQTVEVYAGGPRVGPESESQE